MYWPQHLLQDLHTHTAHFGCGSEDQAHKIHLESQDAEPLGKQCQGRSIIPGECTPYETPYQQFGCIMLEFRDEDSNEEGTSLGTVMTVDSKGERKNSRALQVP